MLGATDHDPLRVERIRDEVLRACVPFLLVLERNQGIVGRELVVELRLARQAVRAIPDARVGQPAEPQVCDVRLGIEVQERSVDVRLTESGTEVNIPGSGI